MEKIFNEDELLAIEYCLTHRIKSIETQIELLTDDLAGMGIKTDFLPKRKEIELLKEILVKVKKMRLIK